MIEKEISEGNHAQSLWSRLNSLLVQLVDVILSNTSVAIGCAFEAFFAARWPEFVALHTEVGRDFNL